MPGKLKAFLRERIACKGRVIMDNILNIRLRTLSRELKHDREYKINLGTDLFGSWYVAITFGRYRTWGTVKTKYCDTREDAYKVINNILKRRLSSTKRIGCPYQIITFDGKDEIIGAMNKDMIQKFSWFSTT